MDGNKPNNDFDLESAFFEEFDPSEVSNRDQSETMAAHDKKITPFSDAPTDQKSPKLFFTEEDIEKLITYDDNRRKDIGFIDKFSENARSVDITEDKPHHWFKDFIIYPKIAGNNKSYSGKKLIPSEVLGDEAGKVEISDDPTVTQKGHTHTSTISLHRDDNGELEFIEINCKCGERSLIKIEYTDSSIQDDMTETYDENVEDPTYFTRDDLKNTVTKRDITLDEFENIFGRRSEEEMFDEFEKLEDDHKTDDFGFEM